MNVDHVPRRRFGSDSYQPISALAIRSIPDEAISRYLTHCLRMFISLQRQGSYRYPFANIYYSTTLTILMYQYAIRGSE